MSAPTAPGVHVVEVPSGSRAISGLSTSLTAFVGPALRGPLDQPVTVASWPEYQARFGGLWRGSVAGQAVRHFFLNGGGRALVVRVANQDRLVLEATPELRAVAGFAALQVTVAGGGPVAVTITAMGADGRALKKGDTAYEATVSVPLDADPDDALAGATANDVRLVTGHGSLSDAPPEGTHTGTPGPDGSVVVEIGNGVTEARAEVGVGLRLRPTPEASRLPAFDRLRATVAHGAGAGRFDLEISAVDAAGTVLRQEGQGADRPAYTAKVTDLDAGDPGLAQAIDAARTGTATPIALASVVGTTPGERPPVGSTDGDADPAGRRELLLATTVLWLRAADAGAWGNRIEASTSTDEAAPGTFHLTVVELDDAGGVVDTERHHGVSADEDAPRAVGRLLELGSSRVRVEAVTGAGERLAPLRAGPTRFAGGRDGAAPRAADTTGAQGASSGLWALTRADVVNLVCVPLASWSTGTDLAVWTTAAEVAERCRAVLLVDPPQEWSTPEAAADQADTFPLQNHANAAVYYPRLRIPDPLAEGRPGEFPPCGVVAGVIARTDATRGLWKAPAGVDASLRGVTELAATLDDPRHGDLNRLGVNCLRTFPVYGRVVWGARTLRGSDLQASEWKYLPVRRLALYLEESLRRGTRWAVFEPNGPGLWSQLRLDIGGFLQQLFRQGAFAGSSAAEAYFVKCDSETTTAEDVERGLVNVVVGYAPLSPAEFVTIRLQQLAAQAG